MNIKQIATALDMALQKFLVAQMTAILPHLTEEQKQKLVDMAERMVEEKQKRANR